MSGPTGAPRAADAARTAAQSAAEEDAADQAAAERRALLRGAAWMSGSLGAFTLMAFAGRELAGDANPFQILFWRSLFGVAIVIFAAAFVSPLGLAQFATRRPGLHALRNVFHFTGQSTWFYAIALQLPLAQLFALEFTSPIWVAAFAALFLGERFTTWRAIAAALGFVGVMIVLRPEAQPIGAAHALALIAAVGFAANITITKRLSADQSTLCILFWMTVSQALMALSGDLIVSGRDALPLPDARTAGWLLVVAICGLSAHYCVTRALSYADASLMSPIEFLRLPVIAVAAAAIYGEALEAAVLLGGSIIFFGNFMNLRAEARRRRGAR